MRDGRDDVFDSGPGIKNIVTIDTDRHAWFRRGCKGALLKGRSLPGSDPQSAGAEPLPGALGRICGQVLPGAPSESATAPFDGLAVKSAFALLSRK